MTRTNDDRPTRGSAAPAMGLRSHRTELNEEHRNMLISQELARERIRDLDREIELMQTAARVRALRRARRDAEVRTARLRRLLLAR
jgi:hypothetical protein